MSLGDAARAPAMLAFALAIAVAGCRDDAPAGAWAKRSAPVTARTAPGPAVVASVNGTPITAADLALAMAVAAKASPHQAGEAPPAPPVRAEVLDRLIGEELAAQRARARGLDADREFQAELASQEAQLAAFRRQRLTMLLQRDVRDHASVTEADARKFFDANADRIRTVTRVQQILLHDRAAIEAARKELDAGAAFEAVAARQFPNLPPGSTPWDLGALRWNQIPAPWEGVIDGLAVGATSPVIDGPKGRVWIIKVVDRKVNPAITFETAHAAIMTLLQSKAAEAAQADLDRELRAGATIEVTP